MLEFGVMSCVCPDGGCWVVSFPGTGMLRITSFQNVADNPTNRAMCERWPFPLAILRSTGDA